MVRSVESNLDNLVARKLVTGDGKACVVGHLLQTLDPTYYQAAGRLRSRRQLRRWEREIGRRHPRLAHIEFSFDCCVELTRAARPDLPDDEILRAAGIWISVEAQAELARRRRCLRTAQSDFESDQTTELERALARA